MDFSEKLLIKFNKNTNYTLAFICRIAALIMLIVVILTACNVFILGTEIYPVLAVSIVIMLLPTLFYNILHKNNIFLKYAFLTILVLMAGLLYSILSYHVILMLVFPVLVSCLYCEKKYVVYTSVLSYPVIIASHFIAFALKMVPDEPLITLRGVIAYGIVPRLLEFTIMFIIALTMTGKVEKLISDLIEKNRECFENQQTVIYSLSEMIETQSHDTGAHVKRVSEYTKILCKAYGMSDEDTWLVSTAAMMHDVGKLMVPADILNKPGKLTKEEFSKVKEHVEYGQKMMQNAPGELMKVSTEIAHEHHEKFNGEGYLHKSGEDISIYARIVAVADVFDALVSRRPYKEPWDIEKAKQEIISQSGKHFDPELVRLFEEHFDEFVNVYNSYPDEKVCDGKDCAAIEG
ncbi:MAG: HD-GYP domain-containing protein [Candidatus Coproplasma sp.]